MNLNERAEEAGRHFHTFERGGKTVWLRADDAPTWVEELSYAAHGDMLPDDYRYEFIVSALDIITQRDHEQRIDDDFFAEALDAATDVYNADLHAWLSSNRNRAAYVDEAVEELGHSDMGINGDLMLGQYREREEVLALVLDFLADMDDDGTSGQDRKNYTDTQDRKNYMPDET